METESPGQIVPEGDYVHDDGFQIFAEPDEFGSDIDEMDDGISPEASD